MAKTPKTPKPSAKGKTTGVQPKIKYGIFVINLENLGSIARQFKENLKQHERKAVLGFSREDIVREILEQQAEKAKKGKQSKEPTDKGKKGKKDENVDESKDKKGKKDKKDQKDVKAPVSEKPEKEVKVLIDEEKAEPINLELFVLDEKNFGQFYAKTKEHIDKLTKETEAASSLKKRRQEFDLLKYWQEQSDGSHENAGGKKGKGSDDKKDKKGTPRARGGAEKKEKEKKEKGKDDKKMDKKGGKQDDTGCKLKGITVVNLKEKLFSKIQPKKGDSDIKFKFTEDHPLDGLDAYVVLLGNFGKDFYLELIKKNLPLRAISTFLPQSLKPKPNEEITNQTLKDLEDLKHSDHTKGVGIITNFITPLSECIAERFKKQIYDELSWHLYDMENARRQFQNYLDHFKEYDVAEMRPCPEPINILKDSYLPENSLDDNTIPLYLDTLLELVHDSLLGTMDIDINTTNETEEEGYGEYKTDEETENIFITSYCENLVFEDENTLLKTTLRSEIDLEFYHKCAEMLKLVAPFDKVWRIHGKKYSSNTTNTNILLFLVDASGTNDFCEPLSSNAFRQKFKHFSDESDGREFRYYAPYDDIAITFCRSECDNTSVNSVLPTKVGFRDYCLYISDNIKEWTKGQEILYDQKKGAENIEKIFMASEPPIENSDFFRVQSIKWNLLLKQKSLPVVPTNFDNKGKKAKKEDKPADKKGKNVKETKKGSSKIDGTKVESENQKIVFLGYNIGNSRLELDSYRTVCRSKNTILKLFRDVWVDGHRNFRLRLKYKNIYIFYSRDFPTNHNPAKLRFETEDLITFAITHAPLPAVVNGEEEGAQEGNEEQEEESYPHVTMTWPSILRIECIFDPETKILNEVRQYSWRKSLKEKSRFVYFDGTVIVNCTDGAVRVYKANGTLYETRLPFRGYGEDYMAMYETSDFTFYQNKYQNEIDYIMRYHELLDSENYLLTTSEGYNFEVRNGQIVAENHKFLNIEWFDYATGERFSSREDGVKTSTTADCLTCYYPDNTLIKSYTNSRMLYKYFSDENGQESFIIFTEGEHSGSATAVTKSIIKELVNIASDELFVYADINHLFQHECFATVRFDKENSFLDDKVTIYSPGGVNLSITEKKAFINVSEQLYLDVSKDGCLIRTPDMIVPDSTNTIQNMHSKGNMRTFINFKIDEDLPLFHMTDIEGEVIVKHDFVWTIDRQKKDKGRSMLCPFELVLERNFEAIGYVLYSEYDVSQTLQASKDPDTVKLDLKDTTTILIPCKTYNQIFRLPIQELASFLLKFEGNNFACEASTEEYDNFCEVLPKLMTIRCFLRREKFQRTFYPSAVNFLDRASIGSTFTALRNNIRACDLLQITLAKSLEQHHQDFISAKFPKFVENIVFKERMYKKMQRNNRTKVYKAMLRENFYPKYWEFSEAGGHIKYINICKYAKELQISDVTSDECFTKLSCECTDDEYLTSEINEFTELRSLESHTTPGDISLNNDFFEEENRAKISETICESVNTEGTLSGLCECFPDQKSDVQIENENEETPRGCECSSGNSSGLKICVCPSTVSEEPKFEEEDSHEGCRCR